MTPATAPTDLTAYLLPGTDTVRRAAALDGRPAVFPVVSARAGNA